MASGAALITQPDLTDFGIQIIIHYNQVLERYFIIFHIGANRFSGQVHKSHGLNQDGLDPADHPFTDHGFAFVLIKAYSVSGCKLVERHKPDIVPCLGILGSRISESNNPFHDSGLSFLSSRKQKSSVFGTMSCIYSRDR
ncbi:hypothetical protein D3C85_1398310 [compost metagenome]